MPSVEVYVGHVDVDVDLEDFSSDDLRDELEHRGEQVASSEYVVKLLTDLYNKRRNGLDYTWELDELLHQTIGRIS